MSPDRNPRRVPDEPPRLLPGRSAMSWNRISLFGIFAALAGFALVWVDLGVLPTGDLTDGIAYALFFAIIAFALVFGIAGIMRNVAWNRERRAGYTTTYDPHDRDLWLLDWRTGEVLYRPGEARTTRRSDRA